MSHSQYNPEIHHRKSIRLKGHDYAGGGLYFVTICAHRKAGDIFADPAVKAMVAREWESALSWIGVDRVVSSVGAGLVSANACEGRREGGHKARPYVIMPDHFHALVRIPSPEAREGGGHKARPYGLGDVICRFKSLVVHEYIAKVKAGEWPPFPGKIWQRNYYESIVWDTEAEQKISEYIRMNPWKLIVSGNYEGLAFRAIGNPNLLNLPKMGVFCSRRVPNGMDLNSPGFDGVFMSGFHSPPEKEILTRLLAKGEKMICCPSWGIDTMRIPDAWLPALEGNRMMILEMSDRKGDLSASEARNRFVLQVSDQHWVPYATPGGMLDRLIQEGSGGAE